MKTEKDCRDQSWKSLRDFGPIEKVFPFACSVATLAAAILFFPFAGWAGGVVSNCTETDLRAAMAGGGTVTFACDGTITLARTITNTIDTVLDGSSHQVTISGNRAVRVFCVNTNVSFTAINLIIADGISLGGSAILNLGGTANLTGVTFRSNTATLYVNNDELSPRAGGGAIFNRGGTVNASNCSFAGNTAQTPMGLLSSPSGALVYGGAIRNEAGQVALRSCAFVGNRAAGGAVIYSGSDGDPGFGGAIHNNGTVTLDLCSFSGNSASGGTAAPYPQWAGFSGSEGSGGAIFNQGTLTADRTSLCGNTATGGSGGMGGANSSTPLQGYPGGTGAWTRGGAICNLGSIWVTRSTFASNVVSGGAGGPGGNGVAFMDIGGNGGPGANGGSGLGGALFNGGAATLVNCSIAFNTGSGGAGGHGGNGAGLRSGASGAGGAGGNGGSGFGGVDGTCNLTNCTLAWNQGNAGSGGAGGAASFGNPGAVGTPGTSGSALGGTVCNLLANTLIASNSPAGHDSFIDPRLGPFADNGGPTLTIALMPGSPAIDAGDTTIAPPTDQRGFPRPAGPAADIGAFEYGSVMPVVAISRSDAGLNILGGGNTGMVCRLLTSTDLFHWVPIATNQISSDGTILFHDSGSAGGVCRFYRLVVP